MFLKCFLEISYHYFVYHCKGVGGQTRPAAMHVDDYQAAEDSDHKRSYSPEYDSTSHSPRYRSPPYQDRS